MRDKEVIRLVEAKIGSPVLYVVFDNGDTITRGGFIDKSTVMLDFKGKPKGTLEEEGLADMGIYRFRTKDKIYQFNPVEKVYLEYDLDDVVVDVDKDVFLDSFAELMRGLKR